MNIHVSEETKNLIEQFSIGEGNIDAEARRLSDSFSEAILQQSITILFHRLQRLVRELIRPLKEKGVPNHYGGYGLFIQRNGDDLCLVLPYRILILFTTDGKSIAEATQSLLANHEDILERVRSEVQETVNHALSAHRQAEEVFQRVWASNPLYVTYLSSPLLRRIGKDESTDKKPVLLFSLDPHSNVPYRLHLGLDGYKTGENDPLSLDRFTKADLFAPNFDERLKQAIGDALVKRVHRHERELSDELARLTGQSRIRLQMRHGEEPVSLVFQRGYNPMVNVFLNASEADIERAEALLRVGELIQSSDMRTRRILQSFTIKTPEETGGLPYLFGERVISTDISHKDFRTLEGLVEEARIDVLLFARATRLSDISEDDIGFPGEIFCRRTSTVEFDGHRYDVFHFKAKHRRLKMRVFRDGVRISNRAYYKAMRRRNTAA